MSATEPVKIPGAVVTEWSESLPLTARILEKWARHAPRMRAALPTFCGTHLLSKRKMVLRAKSGARFAVEPADLGTYFAMLNNGPLYPTHVLELCKLHLNPGDVLYDIGANIGFITTEIAHHFGGRVPVIAFEPQSRHAETVAISALLNLTPEVSVFDLLLGEKEATAELFLTGNSAHASIKARAPDAKPVTKHVVPLDTLRRDRSLPPPTLIKIDVEGAELVVLRGAVETLREHQPYLVFEADANMQRFGYGKAELFELIRSAHDYAFYDVECDADGHFARVRRIADASESRCDDIFAVPKSRSLGTPA